MKSITLYYRQGSSDKVYQVRIEPAGTLFVVHYAYGRRGSTLSTGTKTPQPVDLATAEKVFAQLVREKQAKGYTVGADGTPYQHSPEEGRVSGYLPQLLNPLAEEELPRLIADPEWCFQEKYDGQRLLIQKQGTVIHGINRRGLIVALPQPVLAEVRQLAQDCVLDGESVGEYYHVFDLLSWQGTDYRPYEYRRRLLRLLNDIGLERYSHVQTVPSYATPEQKQAGLASLRLQNKEGVVCKRLDAPYVPGRPSTGGSQLKCKFYATASFLVGSLNPQRSVSLWLMAPGHHPVRAGNVTIPPQHSLPQEGAIVEVRYLYAFRQSGAIYQPTYLGLRPDLEASDCTTTQLKYRASEDEESDQ